MVPRVLLFLFIAVCAAFVGGAAAQPAGEAAWQVVLYDEFAEVTGRPAANGKMHLNAVAQVEQTITRQLHFIDATGLRETVTLPPLYGERDDDFFAYEVFMSPDLRYAVIESSTMTEQETLLSIVDLATMDVIFSNGTARFHSNFRGTEFAAAYQYADYDPVTDSISYENGLMTVDAATGAVTAQIALPEIVEALDSQFDFLVEDVIVGSWQDDGVHFLPSCRNCASYHLPTYAMLGADIYAGLYYVWNPNGNTITQSADDNHLDFAERLAGTGEILQLGPAGGYQVPEAQSYGVTGRNTVRYWRDDDAVMVEGRIVYQAAEDTDFAFVHWVLDGNAFLMYEPDSGAAALVYRNGAVQSVEQLRGETVVSTVDGWLTVSEDEGVYAYSVEYGAINERAIMQFTPDDPDAFVPLLTPRVAYMPPLGLRGAGETSP